MRHILPGWAFCCRHWGKSTKTDLLMPANGFSDRALEPDHSRDKNNALIAIENTLATRNPLLLLAFDGSL